MEKISSFQKLEKKILTLSEAIQWRNNMRIQNRSVVFTNGVFDILHHGHLFYLSQAKDLGSTLIVGVNSDESVRRLKGPQRPINALEDRMLQLAALEIIDAVTFFAEDTPMQIISALQPDIHVKGGDYRVEDLPEAAIVHSYQGRVIILNFVNGYSTTATVQKIRESR